MSPRRVQCMQTGTTIDMLYSCTNMCQLRRRGRVIVRSGLGNAGSGRHASHPDPPPVPFPRVATDRVKVLVWSSLSEIQDASGCATASTATSVRACRA
eukprot:scaffold19185_cov52-Attheya_sp.AAC.1